MKSKDCFIRTVNLLNFHDTRVTVVDVLKTNHLVNLKSVRSCYGNGCDF